MPKPQKGPARATTACTACRSRKQKCSGEKPVCGQCLEYNRPCEWPEHLKRGPAKGYVETLEHRLQVTENALFKLLSNVPDSQLKKIFPEGASSRKDFGTSYAPLARIEKKGIDHWAQYPLDTAENIRKWQQACTGWKTDDSNNPSPSGTAVSSPSRRNSRGTKRNIDDTEDEVTHRPERLPVGQYRSSVSSGLDEHREKYPRTSHTLHWGLLDDQEEPLEGNIPTPPQTSCSWDGAPSVNFQQQFLW
ncbi:hypothetical protein N7494_003420 [Penicillium frequentans]|uniref:Zn(2)-C6 fungal-type domain-containing protein n=1 Tax=Penicillium frequentans TaxID=3151616 RepID=A0AAD6GFP9_9EURO|nr:hypothetical protein N7494_003420 [Penicillium glabrum]